VIARYVIHYADGQESEIPIVYGELLRDRVTASDPTATTRRAACVWPETNAVNHPGRLYYRTWENLRPEMEVMILDLVPCDVPSKPVLVALTVEP
jgi:hypothetical protein